MQAPTRDQAKRYQLRQHCAQQGRLDERAARAVYAARLNAALTLTACEPGYRPVPVDETSPDREWAEWIDPARVVVHCGFEPFHHSRDEVLEYALEHRGDARELLGSMPFRANGLDVLEYPAPQPAGSLYFVRLNGNHRGLVYRAVGLPVAAALVKSCTPGWWRVDRQTTGDRWLPLFKRLGVIDEWRPAPNGDTDVADPTGCLGWVVPPRQHGTITYGFGGPPELLRAANAIAASMTNLDRIAGPISDPRAAVLRDRDALYDALRVTYNPARMGALTGAIAKRLAPASIQGECQNHA